MSSIITGIVASAALFLVLYHAFQLLHHNPSETWWQASSVSSNAGTTSTTKGLRSDASSLIRRDFPQSSPSNTAFSDVFPDRKMVYDSNHLHDILAGFAYDNIDYDEKKLREYLAGEGYNLEYVEVEKLGSTVMIVTSANYPDTPIVVFRGSDEDDLQFTTTDVQQVCAPEFENAPIGMKIHRGFHRAMFTRKVVYEVEEVILSLLPEIDDESRVIVVGNSLGAANAQIMGSYLAGKYPSLKVPVIGFGSPVVGNAVFKTWVEETLTNLAVWRYVYKNDIVPRFHVIYAGLIWALRYEYCLSGHLINFDVNGSVKAYYRQGGDMIKQYAGAPWSWYYPTWKFNWEDHVKYYEWFYPEDDVIFNDDLWPTEFEKCSETLTDERSQLK